MILFFYNVALMLALALSAPWWLFRMATTRKYRDGILERLGRVPKALLRSLKQGETKPVIWIHAVSVGEVLGVSRLVIDLAQQLPEYRVLVSTTTRTGQELARERFGADQVFYCPLDLWWAVSAYLNALRPAMLVLVETEFWPNLLNTCFRREIPVAVVNARISDRSWPRYWRLRRLWQPWLDQLALVLAQTRTDADRLTDLGCDPARVLVNGNLKFDVRANQEAAAASLMRGIVGDLRLVVAGSTLEGEESALLEAWPELLQSEPKLALVLAPRHPERFEAVASLLHRTGYPWRRRSRITRDSGPLVSGEIVLLDTIGELASLYSLAAVAFVGGSLVPAGGHNPLEPARFGVPVIMGGSYTNFLGIVGSLLAADALWTTEPGELAVLLGELLADPDAAHAMGERGRRVFEKEAGATARSVAALQRVLAEWRAV